MKHIFLVEDDLSLIGGLSFAVRKQGYEIDIARTSLEADAMWAEGKYDLIILDVSPPFGRYTDVYCNTEQNFFNGGSVFSSHFVNSNH